MSSLMTSLHVKSVLDKETGAQYNRCEDDLLAHVPYRPVSNIHVGDTTQVFLMERPKHPKEFVAAKVFSLDDEDFKDRFWETFRREVSILQELKHENIVKCRLAITSPSLGVIFMDYIAEGPIRQHLTSPMLYKNVHRYFIQIACALRHMHSKRIVHRDVSLDNILVKNNTAYLADFGLSRKLPAESSNMFGLVGTLGFQAPEVRTTSLAKTYEGFIADSYSLGAVLWCLLTKEEPNYYFTDMFHDIKGKEKVDPRLKECALGLLEFDPKKRWGITIMLEYLKHHSYHAWYIKALSK